MCLCVEGGHKHICTSRHIGNILFHAYEDISSTLTQVSCDLIACSLILLLSCRQYSIDIVDMHTFMYTDSIPLFYSLLRL